MKSTKNWYRRNNNESKLCKNKITWIIIHVVVKKLVTMVTTLEFLFSDKSDCANQVSFDFQTHSYI